MSSRRARQRRGTEKGGWLGRSLVVAGIGALVVLVGGYVGVRRYLHSEGFRRLLSEEVSRSIGVAGNFGSFRWDGLQVDTSSFEAAGEGQVQALKAEKLHAEVGLGAVTRGIWQVRGANVDRVEATFDARSRKATTEKPAPVNEGTSEAKKNGWLPSEVVLEELTVQNADVRALLDSGPLAIAGMKIKVEPDGAKNSYRAVLTGGSVTTPWALVPAAELTRVKARYHDRSVFLTEATATLGSQGRLEAQGEWNGNTGVHAFEGSIADVACADLLSETWSKRLTGRVDSSFVVQGRKSSTKARGKLVITDGVLTALPFLDTLAAYADTRKFRVLQLTEARTEWTWEKEQTTLDRLVLASEGLVRLEGSLVIRGEAIDGNFRLGLAPGTLASIPGAETDVFLPGESGLLWAPIHITGTLDDPKEDLSDRLRTAAGLRMFEILPQTGERVLKFTQQVIGDDPNKIVQKGLNTVEKGVEKGAEVLGKAGTVVEKAGGAVSAINGVLGGLLGEDPPKEEVPPPPEKK